jgi:acyl carrier protein
MSLLGRLLESTTGQAAVIRLDHEHLNLVRSSDAIARRFSLVVGQSAQEGDPDARSTARALLTVLAVNPPEGRPPLVESALRVDLARLLGVRESQIDPDQPLAELGIDSLMSVELEGAIRSALGIDLPLGFLVSDNVSLRHLSQRLATQSQAAIDVINAGRPAGGGEGPRDAASVAVQR